MGITILSASDGTDPSPGPSVDCAGCPADADDDDDAEDDTEDDRIPPATDRAACFSLSFSLCDAGTAVGGGAGQKAREKRQGRAGQDREGKGREDGSDERAQQKSKPTH